MPAHHRSPAILWLAIAVFLILEIILIILLFTSAGSGSPVRVSIQPEARVVSSLADRPVQLAAVLEAEAAHIGWTADSLRAAGDAWRRAGDTATAQRFWASAVQAGAADPSLYRDLAAVYLEQRAWADADRLLLRLLAVPDSGDSARAWGYLHRGLVRLMNEPQQALTDLRQAVGLEPGYAPALERLLELLELQVYEPFRLAAVLSAASLFDAAAAVMETAISRGDLGADTARGLAYAAVLTAQAGREADAYVQQAFALRPDEYGVLFLSGLYWRLRGEYEASVRAFQAAAAIDASDPIVYAELGYSYEALGDLESARLWLERAAAFAGDANGYADDASRLARSIDDVLMIMGVLPPGDDDPQIEMTTAPLGEPNDQVQAGGTSQDAPTVPSADPIQ